MILFLPLLALGIAYFAGRGHARAEAATSPTVSGVLIGAAPAPSPAEPPSPLVVLDAFLRLGQVPPPPVIMCAIAQAELMGRNDLAEDIVRAFVLPVVRAAQAPPVMPMMPQAMPAMPTMPMMPMMPAPAMQAPQDIPGMPSLPQGPWGGSAAPQSQPMPGPIPGAPPQVSSMPRTIGRPEDVRVEVIQRDDAPRAAAPQTQSSAGTITVSGRSCPIDGVDARKWEEFAARVAREQPTFSSPRHVGQFRQRRDRLAELGIDPSSVSGSPQAQFDAFARDMGDAHHHAQESGLVAEYRGVTVEIPRPDGQHVPIEVTLSGVLGVIQAAGLEGAAEWLEKPADRVRYPGTTAAFCRTNGVF